MLNLINRAKIKIDMNLIYLISDLLEIDLYRIFLRLKIFPIWKNNILIDFSLLFLNEWF